MYTAVSERIPVTVLTGHLGAGKTTLLNRILSGNHGRRYAVIVNEFGEIGIDADLIVSADEELFEMNNGCICCTVRGDLIRTLHQLLAARELGRAAFDAIIVETTGLAAPGPVAQTFLVDPYLQARTALDSITTLVDAKHILLRLADSREAVEQIAFADQIVLNKTDLVAAGTLSAIKTRLRRLNPLAPIHFTQRADAPLNQVLGQGGFDLDRLVLLEPALLEAADVDDDGAQDHVHDASCAHAVASQPFAHDQAIASVSLALHAPLDHARVNAWLNQLVAAQGQDILRGKGIIDIVGERLGLVFQSVHMLIEGELRHVWKHGETRRSRLVFIGRDLDHAALQAGFADCLATAGKSATQIQPSSIS